MKQLVCKVFCLTQMLLIEANSGEDIESNLLVKKTNLFHDVSVHFKVPQTATLPT